MTMAIYRFTKYFYASSLMLTLAGLSTAPSALAATFTVGGFTWDSNNAVTSGEMIEGDFNSVFLTGFPDEQTVGSLFGFGNNTSVNLGDSTNQTLIELTWDGQWLPNQENEDFVVYENGSSSAPEAFAVAVRQAGQSDFTSFLYKFSSAFESPVFATAFDLDEFGIESDSGIDAIRILNLTTLSTVDGSDGQGFLVANGFAPQTGPQGDGSYDSERFDPDITYVVGLNDILDNTPPTPTPPDSTHVPEPGTISAILLLTTVFGLRSRKNNN